MNSRNVTVRRGRGEQAPRAVTGHDLGRLVGKAVTILSEAQLVIYKMQRYHLFYVGVLEAKGNVCKGHVVLTEIQLLIITVLLFRGSFSLIKGPKCTAVNPRACGEVTCIVPWRLPCTEWVPTCSPTTGARCPVSLPAKLFVICFLAGK